MTLRLVSENPTPGGEPNYDDIPAMLRRYANKIEAELHGETSRIVLITETDNGLLIAACGEETTSYELMGLFEAAKLRVFADDVIEDD